MNSYQGLGQLKAFVFLGLCNNRQKCHLYWLIKGKKKPQLIEAL
jgi:hypothetical protein